MLDAGAMLRLDGQRGFGQVVGREAMALGIERAKQHGSCVVALGNAHHLGRIGAWAELAAAQGLVSLHFVNVHLAPDRRAVRRRRRALRHQPVLRRHSAQGRASR